jgi:Cu/Ag efflux protein CusF
MAMNIARIILAGTAALVVSSAALADQDQSGMVTQIDRLSHTIAIQATQSGTVGANTGGTPAAAAEQFKADDGVSLEDVHAGDRVSFSVKDAGGTKVITKLQRQK